MFDPSTLPADVANAINAVSAAKVDADTAQANRQKAAKALADAQKGDGDAAAALQTANDALAQKLQALQQLLGSVFGPGAPPLSVVAPPPA